MSSFVASWIPVGIPHVLFLGQEPLLGHFKFCGFLVGAAVGTPHFLWFHTEDPSWDIPSKVFCGFLVKIPVGTPQILFLGQSQEPRLGHLKFCGFAIKIRLGTDTASFVG